MINENVSDSAAATQQQHLVLHQAPMYIQGICGGPAGEGRDTHTNARTHTQPAELEKVLVTSSPSTMSAKVVNVPTTLSIGLHSLAVLIRKHIHKLSKSSFEFDHFLH